MRQSALIATVLAVLCASALALPARGQEAAAERRVALEREVVQELNRARASRGLQPLRLKAGLTSAAVAHSRSMLVGGYFSHESADGTAFHNRIRRHYTSRGWAAWSVGETLFASAGAVDARTIVVSWLRSPPHRDILLDTTWRDVGVGAVLHSSAPGAFQGAETLVVTADFGLREGRTTASRAAP